LQRILDSFFLNYAETEVKKIPVDELDNLESMIEPLFFFAVIWSIGTTGDDEGR
jgi:dynein heavy chain